MSEENQLSNVTGPLDWESKRAFEAGFNAASSILGVMFQKDEIEEEFRHYQRTVWPTPAKPE